MGMHKGMTGKIGPGSADLTLKDYIARKQLADTGVTFGITQNGGSWSLSFDCVAPDTKEEAIKLAKKILEDK